MNKPEYTTELESQFIMRLPEEPAKALRDVLKTGESFKNRLTIQIENDMRYGEVRFDQWLLHAKIVDLPTIVESLKTIDRKSVYKTADICQLMICNYERDPSSTEGESPTRNKKKDPLKVDKKFLWPHGITPPTKNVRKKRFRKTLKKKCLEAPEVEKEVKRLLRADNEAVSISWEVITEEEDSNTIKPKVNTSSNAEKINPKIEHKQEKIEKSNAYQMPSNVEDIFGGALSDSDLEDENINVDVSDSRLSSYDSYSSPGLGDYRSNIVTQFTSEMFNLSQEPHSSITTAVDRPRETNTFAETNKFNYSDSDKNDVNIKIQQLHTELEELKQRRQRTQHEILGMENMALRQRFQDILRTLNEDIKYKEIEYQNLTLHFN